MADPLREEHVVVPAHVVVRAMPDATILLNTQTGRYFTLDDVGARAWALLAASSSLQATCDALLDEFDVAPDVLRSDLEALVDRLSEAGLLERGRG